MLERNEKPWTSQQLRVTYNIAAPKLHWNFYNVCDIIKKKQQTNTLRFRHNFLEFSNHDIPTKLMKLYFNSLTLSLANIRSFTQIVSTKFSYRRKLIKESGDFYDSLLGDGKNNPGWLFIASIKK